MKQLLVFVIVMIGLLGCTPSNEIPYKEIIDNFNKENNIAKTQYTLKKSHSVTLPIDSLSWNHSYYPIYFDADSTHYYITGNIPLNSLDFYDLKQEKLVRRNFYNRIGPEGISKVSVATIKDFDSIFLYHAQKVIHTNYVGDVLATYHMPQTPVKEITKANMVSPLIYYQNSLLLLNTFYGESFNLSDMPIFKFYKLDQNIFDYSTITYPDFLKKYYCVYRFEDNPKYAMNGNTIVYRYGFSNLVHQYHLGTEKHESYPMKSKYQNKPLLPFNAKSNSEINGCISKLRTCLKLRNLNDVIDALKLVFKFSKI